MCGNVGIAGALTGTTDKIFKTLLILDSLRGIDSTGMAAVDRTGDVKVVKHVGNPFDLMGFKVFDTTVNRLNKVLIGHNRFATQGGVNRRNAHPFEFDTLVGTHNGTLHNKHKLKDANTFQVDSENLYHHLEQEGLDSLLDVIDGAWSLVWWDKVNHKLNFLRNKERPMWLCSSKNNSIVAWASEKWMLEAAIARESIPFDEPMQTQVDQLYSFEVNDKGEIDKPRIRPAAAKSASIPMTPVYPGNYRNFQHGKNSSGATNLPVVVTPAKVVELKKSRVTPGIVHTKQLVSSSTNFYAGKKDILLECLAGKTDSHGARYIICFDPENRAANIRFYLRRDDMMASYVQREIVCTVGEKYADRSEGIYYKVEYSSVKFPDVPMKTNGYSDAGSYFMDGQGTLIPKKDWTEKYHKGCCWCTAPVFPEDANRFTDTKEIICPECSADTEITKYVNLQ